MDWSAARYTRFERERSRPATDLLNALAAGTVRRVVDLGCGPGNSTALLRRRFPDAALTGLDLSPNMLAAARSRLPDVDIRRADIADWAKESLGQDGERFDLIFANASLQWVPDHESLLPALLGRLTPGGTLAAQIPDTLDETAHVLMRSVAADPRWASRLAQAGSARETRRAPGWYDALLRSHAAEVDVWRTTYHHRLADGPAGIVRWFESTGLRPFLLPLDDLERAEFLADYEAALAHAYPALQDGAVLLPFPRLFFTATVRGP